MIIDKEQVLCNAMCRLGYLLCRRQWTRLDSFLAGVSWGELISLRDFARAYRDRLVRGGDLRVFFDLGWKSGKAVKSGKAGK